MRNSTAAWARDGAADDSMPLLGDSAINGGLTSRPTDKDDTPRTSDAAPATQNKVRTQINRPEVSRRVRLPCSFTSPLRRPRRA